MLEIKNCCKAFGDQTVLQDVSLNIHDGSIIGVSGASGIGKSTLACIIESVKNTRELQELVLFFSRYDVSLSKIKKIQKEFPVNTLEVIQAEPFKLMKIHGFGFATTDAIAAQLGTPLDSPLRIQAAISTVLKDANSSGHLFLERGNLIQETLTLLNSRALEDNRVLAGFAAAFVVGCLACKFMINIVKRGKLNWFAIYCTLVGGLAIIRYFVIQ